MEEFRFILFKNNINQRRLGEILGTSQQSAGYKMKNLDNLKLKELRKIKEYLSIEDANIFFR